MSYIADYFFSNLIVTIFLCLSLGYMVGKVRIRSFTIGATAGSLIVSLLVGLLINQFVCKYASAIGSGQNMISGTVSGLFFALFCFTIGFEVGPAFFSSLKTSGIKIVLLSVFFSAVSLITVIIMTKVFHLDIGTGAGLIAGALTQSAVLGVISEEIAANAAIAYALTYVFGTIGVILFVKKIAPAILHKDLYQITKEKIDSISIKQLSNTSQSVNQSIQVRAYRIEPSSLYCGYTVEEAEGICECPLEIEAVYREGQCISDCARFKLRANDVIQVVGGVHALNLADNNGLCEVSDAKYFQVKLIDAEIVLTREYTDEMAQMLSNYGICIKNSMEHLHKHSIIQVVGSSKAINDAAKHLGYLKENGDTTDVSLMSLFVAIGLMIGAVPLFTKAFSLGSVAVLLVGMLVGWYYSKEPRYGYIPSSARWLLKNVGLNLYIVVTALNISGKLIGALSELGSSVILIIVLGTFLTLIPHTVSLLFGKYALHISDADLLGGLCGCGTCTAGLNSLTEETNSSVFAIGYAPGCAAGNILLVVIGILYLMI